jgi:hypothetical protein
MRATAQGAPYPTRDLCLDSTIFSMDEVRINSWFQLKIPQPDDLHPKGGRSRDGADSEEKHEPATDIDAVTVDSLKVLDPEWPIREADIRPPGWFVRKVPQPAHAPAA